MGQPERAKFSRVIVQGVRGAVRMCEPPVKFIGGVRDLISGSEPQAGPEHVRRCTRPGAPALQPDEEES